MWNQKPSFRFAIDNLSEKEGVISSTIFKCGGCEWFLSIYPKGARSADGYLSVYLSVANSSKLPTGWKRSIDHYFVLLNQSDEELRRSPITMGNSFCAKTPSWGYRNLLPLSKFQEKGVLENDKLIIEVYINVNVEAAFDGEGGDVSDNKKQKTVDINGFQVFASQVTKVGKIFTEHPEFAKDFKPTNQEVKTAYMNVLLRVIKTLNKPPMSLSETRLSKASSELSELMNVGFKLDWLKSKLEEVSLDRNKPDVDGSKVQQIEDRVEHLELKLDDLSFGSKISDYDNESRARQVEKLVKNLELKLNEVSLGRKIWDDDNEARAKQIEERVKNLELKHDEVSLGRKKADDTNESRAKQLEKRVKNLELKELAFKLDSLERKKAEDINESLAKKVEQSVKNLALMELGFNKRLNTILGDLERKKSYETSVFDSRIQRVEEHVNGLRFKLESLITKLEEISNEKKKADDVNGFLIQQLEQSIKNIELMVSHVKIELDKKKDKSCADGFLLVD
ncbi:unnamed protein product [Eruca vesicaria subsp. sativa]|uniref:MATH domain-containing protein n=1 Tax=Eruca vesicaria subsp. sativa TaxID=29727 RepID=A0ABC8M0R7_ERUVS|nr:unnamed protein product [Eruca vesicaria subsp. sativa]